MRERENKRTIADPKSSNNANEVEHNGSCRRVVMSLVEDGLFVGCPCRFLVSHADALGESQHIFHFNQIGLSLTWMH